MRRSFSFLVLTLFSTIGVLGCAPTADDVQAINSPGSTETKPPVEPPVADAKSTATKPPAKPERPDLTGPSNRAGTSDATEKEAAKPAASSAKPPKSTTPIDPMFALAKTDPAVIADLVVQGSARVRVSDGAEAASLGDRLEPFLSRVFFGGETIKGSEQFDVRRHAVQAGDTPWKLAPLFKVDAALLTRINPGVAPTKLRIGQRIKVVDLSKGELEITIDLARHRLALWHLREDGSTTLLMFVPIASGAATTPTPVGTTTIARRVASARTMKKSGDEKSPDTSVAFAEGFLALDANALDAEHLAIHASKGGAKITAATVTDGDLWLSPSDLTRLVECVRDGTRVVIRAD